MSRICLILKLELLTFWFQTFLAQMGLNGCCSHHCNFWIKSKDLISGDWAWKSGLCLSLYPYHYVSWMVILPRKLKFVRDCSIILWVENSWQYNCICILYKKFFICLFIYYFLRKVHLVWCLQNHLQINCSSFVSDYQTLLPKTTDLNSTTINKPKDAQGQLLNNCQTLQPLPKRWRSKKSKSHPGVWLLYGSRENCHC